MSGEAKADDNFVPGVWLGFVLGCTVASTLWAICCSSYITGGTVPRSRIEQEWLNGHQQGREQVEERYEKELVARGMARYVYDPEKKTTTWQWVEKTEASDGTGRED